MARIQGLDPRNPTLGPGALRVAGAQIKESAGSAAGVYTADIKIPAYAVVYDIIVHNEELWTAGTSATLEAGMYTDSDGSISTAEDADGFYAAVNVKATDLTKGQSLSFNRAGGKGGASLTEDTSTHYLNIVGDDDRWLRVKVTTVGTVGTAGETYVYALYGVPEMDEPTFTAS